MNKDKFEVIFNCTLNKVYINDEKKLNTIWKNLFKLVQDKECFNFVKIFFEIEKKFNKQKEAR